MENKFKTIQEFNPEAFDKSVNEFCKGKKVFATQTHVLPNPVNDSNFLYIACIYYEYDEKLPNEKPSRPLNKDNYFGSKPNLKPSPNSKEPATANQIWTLINKCNIQKETAEKMTKFEASQIISEKKRSRK